MFKFFVNEDQIKGNTIKINGEDINHIVNVLRLRKSDEIIVCNKDNGKSYITKIENIDKEYVEVEIEKENIETTESNVSIDLFQGLPKADKMEYIIQKATEIGVKNIFPISMERCIVKLDAKSEAKKIERWQKIAEVAAKQSKRDFIPKVENVIKIENICQNVEKYDIILIAYENEKNVTLKTELRKLDKSRNLKIGVIVGPEGGVSKEEIQELISYGVKCITLGKRILRTETAPLVLLSDIIYEFEL